MKKNVKKILAVALAAVALGSFLAGCGTDTDKGAATAEKKVVTVGVNPGSGAHGIAIFTSYTIVDTVRFFADFCYFG